MEQKTISAGIFHANVLCSSSIVVLLLRFFLPPWFGHAILLYDQCNCLSVHLYRFLADCKCKQFYLDAIEKFNMKLEGINLNFFIQAIWFTFMIFSWVGWSEKWDSTKDMGMLSAGIGHIISACIWLNSWGRGWEQKNPIILYAYAAFSFRPQQKGQV